MKYLVLLAILLMGGIANAGIVDSGDFVKVYDSGLPRYENAGPFRVDSLKTPDTWDLTSFCLERDEYLNFGTTYVAQIDTVAWRGGVNTNLGDPLDTKSAFLYSNFFHNTLAGYLGSNVWSQKDLQEVFWYIEEESPGKKYSELSSGAKSLYDVAASNADGTLYDARVMNLYGTCGEYQQSLLTAVPEPATVISWLVGMSLVAGYFYRKKI